jgi:hypothetical protein
MVAESPLATLARVLGGVVLMQGSLGHQVLGQLLVMNTNEVAMAGAAAAIAATTGNRNVVGQIVLRTVVPALAVRIVTNKQEERVDRKMRRLDEREQALKKRRRRLRRRERALEAGLAPPRP